MALESLRADLEELPRATPRRFADWLKIATDEERELVMGYVTDTTYDAEGVMKTLRKHGIPITRATILEYRAKQ